MKYLNFFQIYKYLQTHRRSKSLIQQMWFSLNSGFHTPNPPNLSNPEKFWRFTFELEYLKRSILSALSWIAIGLMLFCSYKVGAKRSWKLFKTSTKIPCINLWQILRSSYVPCEIESSEMMPPLETAASGSWKLVTSDQSSMITYLKYRKLKRISWVLRW